MLPRTIPQVMVLAFLSAPVLLATMLVQPTQALSLKDTTGQLTEQLTQPVRTLLGPVTQLYRPTQPTPPPQPAATQPSSQGTQNQAPATAPLAPTNTTTETSSPQVAPASIEQAAPLEKMKTTNKASSNSNASLTSTLIKNPATISPNSDFGWLQPTENGWRLLGVLWYWWLGLLAMLAAAYSQRHRLFSTHSWLMPRGLKR